MPVSRVSSLEISIIVKQSGDTKNLLWYTGRSSREEDTEVLRDETNNASSVTETGETAKELFFSCLTWDICDVSCRRAYICTCT